MKKILQWAIILPTALILLSACGKDDSPASFDVYISNVTHSYSGTSEIKAIATGLNQELASCSAKSSMTLKLPGVVSANSLKAIGNDFDSDFEISDPSVRWTDLVVIKGYASDGTYTGDFVKAAGSQIMSQFAYYCYAEKPVTIKGEYTFLNESDDDAEFKINLSLERGWNIVSRKVYFSILGDEEYETNKIEYVTGFPSNGYWYFFANEE